MAIIDPQVVVSTIAGSGLTGYFLKLAINRSLTKIDKHDERLMQLEKDFAVEKEKGLRLRKDLNNAHEKIRELDK